MSMYNREPLEDLYLMINVVSKILDINNVLLRNKTEAATII